MVINEIGKCYSKQLTVQYGLSPTSQLVVLTSDEKPPSRVHTSHGFLQSDLV